MVIVHTIIKTRGRHKDLPAPYRSSVFTSMTGMTKEDYDKYMAECTLQPGDVVAHAKYSSPNVTSNLQLHVVLRFVKYEELAVWSFPGGALILGQLFGATPSVWIHREAEVAYRKLDDAELKHWMGDKGDYLRDYLDKYTNASAF